jgi:asparagine synthetase B (glutamine-hydrolysing)
MCGIVGIFKIKQQTQELRQKALKMSQKLRHRGPDWNGIYVGGSTILAHERLSIVDPQSGGQPLYSPDRKQILAVFYGIPGGGQYGHILHMGNVVFLFHDMVYGSSVVHPV